jgi:hypothetical protein
MGVKSHIRFVLSESDHIRNFSLMMYSDSQAEEIITQLNDRYGNPKLSGQNVQMYSWGAENEGIDLQHDMIKHSVLILFRG